MILLNVSIELPKKKDDKGCLISVCTTQEEYILDAQSKTDPRFNNVVKDKINKDEVDKIIANLSSFSGKYMTEYKKHMKEWGKGTSGGNWDYPIGWVKPDIQEQEELFGTQVSSIILAHYKDTRDWVKIMTSNDIYGQLAKENRIMFGNSFSVSYRSNNNNSITYIDLMTSGGKVIFTTIPVPYRNEANGNFKKEMLIFALQDYDKNGKKGRMQYGLEKDEIEKLINK